MRRAPVWVTGSAADLAAVQYRPSAYSNPMRVVLRGPLGYAHTPHHKRDEDAQAPPCSRPASCSRSTASSTNRSRTSRSPASARVRRLQSGRLSTYLLYMMIALILALALIPILR